MSRWSLLLSVLLVSWIQAASAGLETFDFTGNVEEDRYKELIAEVRCLVCQNQSLADSDAELAHDLRREIYELMQQGQNDDQIIEFLVARYGDFVLYQPPVKPSTYILWYGPFVLLILGILMLFRTLRQRRQQATPEFSEEEQRRLQQLLDDKKHKHGGSQ